MRRAFGILVFLAVLGTAATAAWATPPGKSGQIMFRRYLDAQKTTGALFTMSPEGTGVKQLTHPGKPDGKRIAFRYALSDDTYAGSLTTNIDIWVADADGTGRHQVTQLTPGSSWDRDPQWSPDGRRLAFVRDDLRLSAEAVFTVNLDGTGLFQVTPWRLRAGNRPDWSPDGRWLVVGAEPNGIENVYKLHPDGTGLTRLTNARSGGYLSSTFSPDGRFIVTARTPGSGPERAADVFVMRADGSGLHPVTRTALWESSVDWGPHPTR